MPESGDTAAVEAASTTVVVMEFKGRMDCLADEVDGKLMIFEHLRSCDTTRL